MSRFKLGHESESVSDQRLRQARASGVRAHTVRLICSAAALLHEDGEASQG